MKCVIRSEEGYYSGSFAGPKWVDFLHAAKFSKEVAKKIVKSDESGVRMKWYSWEWIKNKVKRNEK